jgi:tRNA(Ile)-lysidine synthase
VARGTSPDFQSAWLCPKQECVGSPPEEIVPFRIWDGQPLHPGTALRPFPCSVSHFDGKNRGVPHTPPILRLENVSPDQRLLVGVSGGADSVALLHLIHEAGFRNLVVCHLNHLLRGEESDGDESFVSALAHRLGLPCEIRRVDVQAQAQETGQSLETAGRQARHAFFTSCSTKYGTSRVLLGHHANDVAETVLWNLLRGSYGAKGMRGAQILHYGNETLELIRPLLPTTRSSLRAYLESRSLPWREDTSNAVGFAIRNRIRNEALPLLDAIVGRDTTAALVRAADAGQEQEEIVTWALKQANTLDPQGRLHVPTLRKLPVALQKAAIFRFLQDQGIENLDQDLIRRGAQLLETGITTSSVNLPGGKQLKRREGRLFVE